MCYSESVPSGISENVVTEKFDLKSNIQTIFIDCVWCRMSATEKYISSDKTFLSLNQRNAVVLFETAKNLFFESIPTLMLVNARQ